jgi:hypothetical protein
MTSEKNIGAPVRVERHDPEVVEAVAKAKAHDPGEVRVVGRLEGLRINEETLRQAAIEASQRFTAARLEYLAAQRAYEAAIEERKEEEFNVSISKGDGHG